MNKTIRALIILLLPLSSMGALTVNNGGGATNITSTSAWITATVVSTGAANPYLYFYWGTNDGGTNAASWEHTNSYGVSTQAAYSVQITGLSGSTIYYFRTHATNSSESAWALNTAQFITLTMPTSVPPSSVRMVSVNTNAELRSPMNFFAVNSNMIKNAIGYSDITDTNAVWGNITGSLADQLDLQSALDAKAATNDMMQIQSAIGDLQSATNVLDSAVSELAGQTNTFIQAAADAASATNSIAVHIADTANPHAVTAEQTGAVPTNDPAYLAAMTNFLPADSATNYLAYDPDTRTLSGCVTNIGAGSAYDDSDLRAATNALDIRVSVLESPYQPWVVLNPGDGETCTVTFAHGSLVSITATNGLTTIGFDNDSGYPVAGVSRVGIELWAGTNEIAFDLATITNATTPVIATDAWTSFFFRRTSSNVLWEGRQ